MFDVNYTYKGWRKKFNAYVIRLRRKGRLKYSIFEVVVSKQNMRMKGSYIEKLGFFNPNFSERMFIINSGRLAY
jgi:ribosomal protein S16